MKQDVITEPNKLTRNHALALFAIVILATTMRLWQINESLWVDELHTAWVVSGDVSDIAPRANAGNQSAVYFFLPWLTTKIGGLTEFNLRLPSLVAGVGLCFVMFALTRAWTKSNATALLGALLIAVDRTCLFYATEARVYAIIQLLGLLQIWLFWTVLTNPRWQFRLFLIAGTTLLFYLHYTTVLIVLAEFVCYFALAFQREAKPMFTRAQYLCDLAIMAFLCLPTREHIIEIAARRHNWTFVEDPNAALIVRMFHFDVYLFVPFLIVFVAWFAARVQNRDNPLPNETRIIRSQIDLQAVILATYCVAVPILIATLLTWTDITRLFFPRYLIVSATTIPFITVFIATFMRTRWKLVVFVLLVVVSSVHNNGYVQQLKRDHRLIGDRTEDWQSAVAYLNEAVLDKPMPVIVGSGLIEANSLTESYSRELGEYCLLPVLGIYRIESRKVQLIPIPNRSPKNLLAASDAERVCQIGGAWLIVRGTKPAADLTSKAIQRDLFPLQYSASQSEYQQFGNVFVYRFSIKKRTSSFP